VVVAVRPAAFAAFPADARRHSLLSSVLRRLIVVLGLAVGGWIVSMLVAGAAAAEETSGTDLASTPACSDEVGSGDGADTVPPATDADIQPDRPELDDLDESTTGHTGTADHYGATEYTTSDESAAGDVALTIPAETTQPTPQTEQSTETAEKPVPSTSAGTPSHTPDTLRPLKATEGPEPVEPVESTEAAESMNQAPLVPQLLQATADTLLATTSKLVHTTGNLTGELIGVLPKVTDSLGDAARRIIDIPSRLPDVGTAPGRTLPGITLPPGAALPPGATLPPGITLPHLPLPIGLDDLLGTDPPDSDQPADTSPGEPRTEPVAPAERAPKAPVAPVPTPPQSDQWTDTSQWSPSREGDDPKVGEKPMRPLGPVSPAPTAPASAASSSTSVASSQDNTHIHRGEHGVLSKTPTITQLRLLGVSRDHDAVGIGKEAALPTTSPD